MQSQLTTSTTSSTSATLLACLAYERQVRDPLEAELQALIKATPLISGEDDEQAMLIEELYKLEEENEQMEGEESDEEIEDRLNLLNQVIDHKSRFLMAEKARFGRIEDQQRREAHELRNQIGALQSKIQKLETANEEAKEQVLAGASLEKQAQLMVLFESKRYEELAVEGMERMQEPAKETVETAEMVQLLEEFCEEHFRPAELRRRKEENEVALERMFAELELQSDKENIPPRIL